MNEQLPALRRRLADIVSEYDEKLAALPAALEAFENAGNNLKQAATIAGTFGDTTFDVGHVYDSSLEKSLLVSAWRHVYKGLSIDRYASPNDKRRFEQSMADPAPFTLENISATFGHYVENPRGNILRGLAEVFCDLDPCFKSHDKMKIGVAGLPKRIIVRYVSSYGSHGRNQIESVINSIAALEGKPLVNYREMGALFTDENALLVDKDLPADRSSDKPYRITARGVRLRRYQNGNGHLYFEPPTLRLVNLALAEFYGEVLPDTPDENPEKRKSTAVSKDLQYYPTPMKLAEGVIGELYHLKGKRALEPSCGCGRLMDALRKAGAKVIGIEVDPIRAAQARAKGHKVLLANFLETVPTADYDFVAMNPPFYGKHYAKHVLHALKFLKPGGKLVAILPITARYDHGLVDGDWRDLPVGSFSESGTNINTTVLTIYKPEGK